MCKKRERTRYAAALGCAMSGMTRKDDEEKVKTTREREVGISGIVI